MMWGFAWQNLITRPSRTALAVVGLTIPILAFLGLFSISRGIRDLVGGTLGKMQGLLVLRENSPSPVFSDLPADMAKTLRAIPGVRVVAPEVWKIAPPIDGKGGLGAAAIGMLDPAARIGDEESRQDGRDRGTGPPRAPQAQERGVRHVDLAEGTRRGTVPRPGGHRPAATS